MAGSVRTVARKLSPPTTWLRREECPRSRRTTIIENGPLGFSALKRDVDGISSKVLSDSLDDLEEANIVDREIVSERPVRVEYSLTEFGRSLEPVIFSMRDWGKKYLEPPAEMEN